MTPIELYRYTLRSVCAHADLSEHSVLHSNAEECADARSVLVACLAPYLSDAQTAALIGRTRQGVSFIRSNFDVHHSKWLAQTIYRAVNRDLSAQMEAETPPCKQ